MCDMNDNENKSMPGNAPVRDTGKHFKVNISDEKLNATEEFEDIQNYADMSSTYEPRSERYDDDRARRKEARAHRKRNRVKARKNKRIFTFTWLVMIVLASLTISSYLIGGSNDFLGINRMESEVEVTIPENVTQEELTDILYSSHAIDKPEFFSLFCKLTADIDDFQPGEYNIKTNLDYKALVNELQAGPTLGDVVKIMFPEGLTVVELAELLEENGLSSKDEILEVCNSDYFDETHESIGKIDNAENKYYKLEGYLFPDTYEFYEKESAQSIIKRFLNNFENRIDEEMRADIKASGYTMDEIIVMASIIQGEAANTDDMYMVSAVLHNRLRDGSSHAIYSLDCDSTLYYPYNSRAEAPEGYFSDYSTYASLGGVNGLPAGAICSPGLEAIKAAIYPAAEGSEYYYFCHDSNRTPYYAATMEEHQANLVAAGLA